MHPPEESRQRERLIVDWLNSIAGDAKELWLLGDVFDYWFEYKKVVPRGFSRFIGKLGELSDNGTEIHMFSGNHDVWLFDYFPEEIGAEIHHDPMTIERSGKYFHLSHGDGLTDRDRGYLIMKSMFRSKFLQWCYARIHPNSSAAFAQAWSKKSRYSKEMVHPFKGDNKEEQIKFAREYLKKDPGINYFLFGHRHLPYDVELSENSRAICLGDWISSNTYVRFDGKEAELISYSK